MFVVCLFALFCTLPQFSKEGDNYEFVPIRNSVVELADMQWTKSDGWNKLYRVSEHPAFDCLLSPEIEDSLLSIINCRKQQVGDTLCTADIFYIWKPYFEWMRYVDPHYRVVPVMPFVADYSSPDYKKQIRRAIRKFSKNARILPVTILNVNDTLLVQKSLDDKLRPGDMITAINGTSTDELMKYNYSDRHEYAHTLLTYHSFGGFSPKYRLNIVRGGDEMVVDVVGLRFAKTLRKLAEEVYWQYYQDESVGYLRIPEFKNNEHLVKITESVLMSFRASGAKSVILDLRGNPGGNGRALDRFLSFFIDKDSIAYCEGMRLKISERTLGEYGFHHREMLGEVLDVPEEYIVDSIPLNNMRFFDGLDFYVMMDEGTGSMAASICNILQYNDAAVLVGEPLLRNALRFGEVLDACNNFYDLPGFAKGDSRSSMNAWLRDSNISTVEIDEYTNAVDGILQPDIAIPYVAEEYMTGDDAVLEKLLEIICRDSSYAKHGQTFFKESADDKNRINWSRRCASQAL